jgi:transcriptional/translational regulatory protein YebC/TACO1
MVPDTYTALDTETTRKVLKLIERLEEDDDVQNVYSNIDIPEGFEAE